MLSLGNPVALWLCLATLPVVALYLLRRRFRRRPSGSNFIWSRVAGLATGARHPELRSLLLLALQVAAVLLAAFAASAPALVERRLSRPGLAILVDVSASMGSEDLRDERRGVVTRVDAAVEEARKLIEGLPEGTPVAVFACAGGLRQLGAVTTDRGRAAALARGLSPSDEGFREAEVASALGAWMALREEPWQAMLYTDGGLDLGGTRLEAALGGAIAFVPIGRRASGVGVAALNLGSVPKATEAGFRAWNGGDRSVRVQARLAREGLPVAEAAIDLAPGWSGHSLRLPVQPPEGAWTLDISSEGRALASTRLSVHEPPRRRILLVGRDDPWIKAALDDPALSVSLSETLPEASSLRDLDLLVVEGLRAGDDLPCPLLSIAAIPEGAPLGLLGLVEGRLSGRSTAHPLNRFVSWESSASGPALAVEARAGVSPLAAVGEGVVAAAWTVEGLPRLFLGFDPARSDFSLTPSWPLLVRNFLDWAAPRADARSAYTLVAGEVAERAEPGSFALEGGDGVGLRRAGRTLLLDARREGLYRWTRDGERGYIAVNRPAEEFDDGPRPIAGGRAPEALAARVSLARTDLSFLPLALLVACLVAEWLLWRGPPRRVPAGRRDARH